MNPDHIHPYLAALPGAQQVALVRVAEEASEVIKEVAKALRFGVNNRYPDTGPTNAEKILAEYSDLTEALKDAGIL